MGYVDKIWDEVFAGPQPTVSAPIEVPAPDNKRTAPAIQIPGSSANNLEHTEGAGSPVPSPAIGIGRRASGDYSAGPNSVIPSIVTPRFGRRPTLDSARSLPPGFHLNLPDILSPGSRRSEDNVWRSVFQPGSNKAMDRLGSAKFDKPTPGSPSVYDWFYNPASRSQWR